MGLVACALIIGAASFATAGIPDLDNSVASRAFTGASTLSLFNLPDGSGKPFTEMFERLAAGNTEDGTITLVVNDGLGAPVANLGFQDMWIEAAPTGGGLGLVPCAGNLVADFNTDATGTTVWANPLFASGYSEANTIVYINGDALTSGGGAGLAINHNSADINADGNINLTDTGFFASDLFFGPYNYRSDYNADGNINLTDAGFIGTAIGLACPAP
jgi:hypothetical protein